MEKKLTETQIALLGEKYGHEYAAVKAVTLVEGAGRGYDQKTGLILRQFEPHWFKRKKKDWQKDTKNTLWQANKVSSQAIELPAYNSAYASDPNAAMQSTSWGIMQVMGFHFQLLGFKTVQDMVKFAEESEANQLELGLKFIKTNPKMDKALRNKDFETFAYYYNGEQFKKFNYDVRMEEAYLQAGGRLPRKTTSGVNHRIGASTAFKAIQVIPLGAAVTEIARKKDWSQVIYQGRTGWVSNKYLTK